MLDKTLAGIFHHIQHAFKPCAATIVRIGDFTLKKVFAVVLYALAAYFLLR